MLSIIRMILFRQKNSLGVVFLFGMLLVLCACAPKSENGLEVKERLSKSEMDSLILHYTTLISEQFKSQLQKENLGLVFDLEIAGAPTFENDSILIISFQEIIKFGSYRSGSSSVFFRKEGGNLMAVFPEFMEKEQIDLTEGTNYPNRIPAEFVKVLKVKDDGKMHLYFMNASQYHGIETERKMYLVYDSKSKELKEIVYAPKSCKSCTLSKTP